MTAQVLNSPSTSINNLAQNDHLWKIIEKQRSIIEKLQQTLANVTKERDDLLQQVNKPRLEQQNPSGGDSSQLSSTLPRRYLQNDLDKSPLAGRSFTSSSSTNLSPSSSSKQTPRQMTSSPFDLMFSSNQTGKSSTTNNNIDMNSGKLNSRVPPNQTFSSACYNDKDSPSSEHYTKIPHHQQSAPLAQSTDLHTISTQQQQQQQQQQHFDTINIDHHPSTLLEMVRYEDDYYDLSFDAEEDYNGPGLTPPMSTSPDTPHLDGHPTTPPLPPSAPMLTDIMVQVTSSNITTNEKGKDIFSFTIAVGKVSPSSPQGMEQLWCAEKLFSDFVNLDYLIKSKNPDLTSKLCRLPDRSLFLSKAPCKVDERKNSVEKYIQNVLTLPLSDMSDVCEFLSTNVLEQRSDLPKRKLGYLTKRGKNFGGWKMRFFVLDGPIVNYYENASGPYLGTINLSRAQIGRQVVQSVSGDSFRHAFLILEPKKSAPNGIHRHVLCADSDIERDQWVETMSQFINYDDFGQPPPPPTASDYRQQINKFLRRSTSDTSNSKQARQDPAQRHVRQRSSLDGADLVHSTLQQDNISDDDKKNKSRNFWGKKMFTTNTNNNDNSNNNNLANLLQGGLSAEQAMALMNSGELDGIMTPTGSNEQVERAPNQVFGIPLDEAIQVCRVSHDYELPAVVYRCIEYLEAKDAAQEEGIYRLSGSAAKIKKLKEKFNQEGDVLLLELEEYNHEVHAVAGLLKMWLRELPGSVLTVDLLNDFLHTADIEDRGDRTAELGRLVSLLPLSNYTLLRTLSAHLIRIVQNSGVNKMTLRNLGIVFSATLGIPSLIFNLFLSEFDYVFWTKHDNNQPILPPPSPPTDIITQSSHINDFDTSLAASSNNQQPTSSSPTSHCRRSNRNSIQYIDYAPQSIVSLEHRSEDYVAIINEDDEDNTLGVYHDQVMNQHYRQYQIGFTSVTPTCEYTATVIEPQIRQ
ncbi:hypothetical protein BC941DRAFT_464236 [Chlamydoabsidia padenii]|nr:hypothetical protein BC941DRAFT_464236 [Chlamydoabsidia padenii]